jgi:beta-lactamase superfamily II metal-dependent hydrolase
MGMEIEFFAVGEGSAAGDAITCRYTDQQGYYRVMVIDGGTDASGQDIVDHIKTIYGPDTVVSDVVSTHPDTDHSCGLRAVLRELPVERLWIHGLWWHAPEIVHMFSDPRWTADGLAKAIRDRYPVVQELMELAAGQGAAILEPFAGEQIGPFTVLSPSREVYQHLIPQFRKTPDADTDYLREQGIWLGTPKGGVWNALLEKAGEITESWVAESWYHERLKEGGVTAAENESSIVLLGEFDGIRVLLTGDAGINALNWACDYADYFGLPRNNLKVIQVPQHGSRRNVSPQILDRLLGPILVEGSPSTTYAIASVPKDEAKHPRKMVTNAFLRRGAAVSVTRGEKARLHAHMPARGNEGPLNVLPFYTQVEDYG